MLAFRRRLFEEAESRTEAKLAAVTTRKARAGGFSQQFERRRAQMNQPAKNDRSVSIVGLGVAPNYPATGMFGTPACWGMRPALQ